MKVFALKSLRPGRVTARRRCGPWRRARTLGRSRSCDPTARVSCGLTTMLHSQVSLESSCAPLAEHALFGAVFAVVTRLRSTCSSPATPGSTPTLRRLSDAVRAHQMPVLAAPPPYAATRRARARPLLCASKAIRRSSAGCGCGCEESGRRQAGERGSCARVRLTSSWPKGGDALDGCYGVGASSTQTMSFRSRPRHTSES
jgi:hypothetical protein